jgi:hypothetical protein
MQLWQGLVAIGFIFLFLTTGNPSATAPYHVSIVR